MIYLVNVVFGCTRNEISEEELSNIYYYIARVLGASTYDFS